MTTVSVVIPARDRCKMVQMAVSSVTAQGCCGLEIIVVDDGSTDGTSSILSKAFPEVRLIRTPGIGPGGARNAGVTAARGNVLMFLDSDDVWLPGHVISLLRKMEQGYDAAYGATQTIDMIHGRTFAIPDTGLNLDGACYEHLLNWCFLVPSSFAVTRDVFEKTGGFPPATLGEDWLFFLKVARQNDLGYTGDRPITTRYLHKGSLCCLQNGHSVFSLLRSVQGFITEHCQAGENDLRLLKEKEEWVIQNWGQSWKTIQEWYLAMKKDGIV